MKVLTNIEAQKYDLHIRPRDKFGNYFRGKKMAAIDDATFPFVPYFSINPEKHPEKQQDMQLGLLAF